MAVTGSLLLALLGSADHALPKAPLPPASADVRRPDETDKDVTATTPAR